MRLLTSLHGPLRLKNVIYFASILLVMMSCSPGKHQKYFVEGRAQGTTYHITYFASDTLVLKKEVDSLLHLLDLSFSTYVPASIISRINRNDSVVQIDEHFGNVFLKSVEISEKTSGDFDVTVAPVVNAYGFGSEKKKNITPRLVDSLLTYVGYRKVRLEENTVIKEWPEVMLDFNAIAQGYSVDVLANFLVDKGVDDYLVELGGEVRAMGKKENGEYWKVGIERPDEGEDDRSLQAVVKMKNRALATSGNYRRFYEENGQRYAHIINPHTGYSEKHNLLSVSVFADDCMTADAYATAFMVMGMDKANMFLSENPDLNLDVFFIYDDNGSWKTFASEGLKNLLEESEL